MRTFVVAFEYAWPTDSGSRLRLGSTVHAPWRGGRTDLFSVVPDGRHLFLADTAPGLAAACPRLLTDPALRQRLFDAAPTHYLEAFERKVAESQVGEVAQATVSEGVLAG